MRLTPKNKSKNFYVVYKIFKWFETQRFVLSRVILYEYNIFWNWVTN